MDPLMQFLTWQFLLFSLSIAGVTFVVRLVFEYYKTDVKHDAFWNNLVLPIFPLFLGCMMGWLMKVYPYPVGLVGNGTHILFGLVAGMFSGLVYRVLKSLLMAKLSGNTDTAATVVSTVVSTPAPAPVVSEPIAVPTTTTTTVTTTAATVPDVDPQTVDSIRNSIQQQS